jgi:predicted Zn-dependent protease
LFFTRNMLNQPNIGLCLSHCATALVVIYSVLSLNACTIKTTRVPDGIVPETEELTLQDEEFGNKLFEELNEDFEIVNDDPRYDRVKSIFNHILKAAEAEPTAWHLYLFNQSEIVDVRAIHGNYLFVWSGFLEFSESDDEIAALLACEMAHALAHHTRPVEFTTLSKIGFGIAEITTSIGIMVLSQGMVAIGGLGWMKHLYVEATDLDPLDREYSEEEEREAMTIAYLLIKRSKYSPQAMLTFWDRVRETAETSTYQIRLSRSLSFEERKTFLEQLLPPEGPLYEPIPVEDDMEQSNETATSPPIDQTIIDHDSSEFPQEY